MPHFSLPNQPMQTEKSVAQILASCELEDAEKIGLIGWKNFTSHVEDNHLLFDLPYFLVEALKTVCGKAQFANAAYLLIGENGVRTTNNANEFAHYEYGAALAGNCILKTMDRLKVGKTEMEMAETLAADGQRHSVVTIMATGARFEKANLYPMNKPIQTGERISLTVGYKGGLASRAAFAAYKREDLDSAVRDYEEKIAKPYFSAVCTWLEHLHIGMEGKEVYALVDDILPKDIFCWKA